MPSRCVFLPPLDEGLECGGRSRSCCKKGTIKVGGVSLLWVVVLLLANMVFQASAESCSTSQKFAATKGCGSNNYKDQCSTSFDDNNSCECSSYPNYYFFCTSQCTGYAFKKNGMCVQCAAGQFFGAYYSSSTSGALVFYGASYTNANCNNGAYCCKACPAGYYSQQGAQSCTACASGTYSPSSGSPSCQQCPAGQFQSITGQAKCSACPAGQYQDKLGQQKCKSCLIGTYADTPGLSGCTTCPPGTWMNTTNANYKCNPTPLGYYAAPVQQEISQPFPCPYGSFTDKVNSTVCTLCPIGTSTLQIGSTSRFKCMTCEFGVDPINLGCKTGTKNGLDNVCWNPGQLLGLNNSVAVQDLYNLMYEGSHGVLALINSSIAVIQAASSNKVSPSNVSLIYEQSLNATATWFNTTWGSQKCQDEVGSRLLSNSNLVALLTYQFGGVGNIFVNENNFQNRINWIAYWHCTGATFGCAGPTVAQCPMAATCFSNVAQKFSAILNAPGGMTLLGNNPASTQGRRTPMYSPSFLSSLLTTTIASLTDYTQQVSGFERYLTVMQQIQDSAEDVISFTASAFDASNQIAATQQAANLQSSQTLGNLYYSQMQYNYNVTNDLAVVVNAGPPPVGGDDYNTLVKKCQQQLLLQAILKVVTATIALSMGFAGEFIAAGEEAAKTAEEAAAAAAKNKGDWALGDLEGKPNAASETGAEGAWKLAKSASAMKDSSVNMVSAIAGIFTFSWDPNTQLPTLPNLNSAPTDSDATTYNAASAQWYQNAQKNMSLSLVQLSPAFWESFYLEAENQFTPTIDNPPGCSSYSASIVTSLKEYLNTVKNFTDYGNVMTSAAMALTPVLGNIATAIATLGAISQATQEINALVTPAARERRTAPSSIFQLPPDPVYKTVTQQVLAQIPAINWLNQAYLASFSIYQFCQSYSYMNAGRNYEPTNANCKGFGSNYVPSIDTFNSFANSIALGTEVVVSPSSLVGQFSANVNGFAGQVSTNPQAWGQASGSLGNQAPLAFSVVLTNSTSTFGNLSDGWADFWLSPSSYLLNTGVSPAFQVNDANPRVVDVQVYWRNVHSKGKPPNTLQSNIYVGGQQAVYSRSGEKSFYTLPPFNTSGVIGRFGSFSSVQPTSLQRCGGSKQSSQWPDSNEITFCTDTSTSFQQTSPFLLNSAYLFPSMWTHWRIEAPDMKYFEQTGPVELQIVFQYIKSSSPSPNTIGSSYLHCGGYSFDYNPLANAWCDQPDCSQCGSLALPLMDSVQQNTSLHGGFCLCNIWDGSCTSSDQCATSITGPVYVGLSSSGRRMLKGSKLDLAAFRSVSDTYLVGAVTDCLKYHSSSWNVTGYVQTVSTRTKQVGVCANGTVVVEMYVNSRSSITGPVEQCTRAAVRKSAYLKSLQKSFDPFMKNLDISDSNFCVAGKKSETGKNPGSFIPSSTVSTGKKGASMGKVKGKKLQFMAKTKPKV